MNQGASIMAIRRAALDRLAATGDVDRPPFVNVRVDVLDHLAATARADAVPSSLAEAVADRLVRDGERRGPGVAVVTGVSEVFGFDEARTFHESLFRAVWNVFRHGTDRGEESRFRIKTGIIADGDIPIELYGSKWSFKDLHIDREVLLFSHLYGPVAGFTGGSLLLIDIRPYMARRSLRFEDVFEWSNEATPGSKPVLREEHREPAFTEGGIELASIGPDEIVFINNSPDAGILHGVTPVVVQDPGTFQRMYHRCSVKDTELC